MAEIIMQHDDKRVPPPKLGSGIESNTRPRHAPQDTFHIDITEHHWYGTAGLWGRDAYAKTHGVDDRTTPVLLTLSPDL